MRRETDTLGRAAFAFHSELPITVFFAARGQRARTVAPARGHPAAVTDTTPAIPAGAS